MDLPALDAGEVKGVHRLAVLEHDIVCDVDDIVDGAHARVADALAHPGGGRRDLHVAHHAAGVAHAQRVFDEDFGQLVDVAAGGRLHDGLVQPELFIEGHGRLTSQTDHAQTVGAVRGNLKLHHMVVETQQGAHVVAGFAVLMQDEDAVLHAVGELLLLCVQVLERADFVLHCVVGNEIADVQILNVEDARNVRPAEIQRDVPEIDARVRDGLDLARDDLAEDLVARLDVGGDRGLGGVDGVVVVQKGGGLDDGIGEVVRRDIQLLERAEHTLGRNASELAARDLHAARKQGVVQGRGDKIALVDVPRAGADLDGLAQTDVNLRDQHVVGVGVLFELEDFADLDVFDARTQVLGHLNLGAGDGHGLGKGSVVVPVKRQVYELIEPFS